MDGCASGWMICFFCYNRNLVVFCWLLWWCEQWWGVVVVVCYVVTCGTNDDQVQKNEGEPETVLTTIK
jgi:hypothetical protein